MSMILKPLPCSVAVDGKAYPIYTDFRAWIEFESILERKESFIEKAPELIQAVMPAGELPADIAELITKLFEFYAGEQISKSKKTESKAKRFYSFSYDFDYIYAAFLTQYSIDLCEVQMHWHKFIVLFSGLAGEHKISEIIGYRAMDLSGEKDKKRRAFYRQMKRLYALPDNRTLEEIDSDMSDEFTKLM